MNKHSFESRFSTGFHIILMVSFAFLIRTFGYGLYRVPSESMASTMLVGEFFFANKFSLVFGRPGHEDIVAFNDPYYTYSHNRVVSALQRCAWGPSNWTKRVIGVPGDHIQGRIEHGRALLYRNGVKIDEPYLGDERVHAYVPREHDEFSVHLKDNHYWVMGDNRSNSQDSRFFGPLDGTLIHGKIVFRIASIENKDLWEVFVHPIDFWKSIRWERCAQKIS